MRSGCEDDAAGLRAANARLRAVVEPKDRQVAMLTAALDAALERERRLGLRLLFTRAFAVSWTNNVSERGAKAAKRHQAVSGYWHRRYAPRGPVDLRGVCRLADYRFAP